MHRKEKTKLLHDRLNRYNKKKYKAKRRKLMENLNIGEKVLVFLLFLSHHRLISSFVGFVSLNASDKNVLLKNKVQQAIKHILELLHFSLKILNFQHLRVSAGNVRQNYINLTYFSFFNIINSCRYFFFII